RGKIARKGTHLLLPRRSWAMGSEEPAARAVESLQFPDPQRRKHPRVSAFELDRTGHLALHPRGEDSHRSALFCERARSRDSRRLDRAGQRTFAAFARRGDATREVPDEVARMRAV